MNETATALPGRDFAPASRRRHPALLGLTVLLTAACIAALAVGPVTLGWGELLASLLQPLGLSLPWTPDALQQTTVLQIRLPRVVMGILVGAGLAISGAAMQGMFRNPLAEPGLVGISSGAALAAVTVIVLGHQLVPADTALPVRYLLPTAAFIGGLVTTVLVWRLSQLRGQTSIATLLLAGIAINALAVSGIGLLATIADDQALRSLTFWTLGSLGKANWTEIAVAGPMILLAAVLLPPQAKALNALLLGEAEAGHLGIEVESLKRRLMILVALAVGAAVALAGIIGFVGLVVPHVLRLLLGPDHKLVLPGSALFGAALMVLADTAARSLAAPIELPVGILTSLIGGPFFLWLLLRQRSRGQYF